MTDNNIKENSQPVAWRQVDCSDEGTCCYTYNEMGMGEPLFARPPRRPSAEWYSRKLTETEGEPHAIGTAPSVPDGWQLVPKVPTKQMILAGDESIDPGCYEESSRTRDVDHGESELIWETMLAAAPTYKEKEE